MIKSLTGLRGFAAIWVLLFHLASITHYTPENHLLERFLAMGFSGVDIFFVLSGFLLTIRILKQDKMHYTSYLKKRIYRVIPAYYSQLIFLILLSFIARIPINYQDFLIHALMLHNFSYESKGSINDVYWTLPLEFWFYFILPFFFINRKWSITLLLIAIIFSVLYKLSLFPIIIDRSASEKLWILYQLPGVIDEFALGALFAIFRVKTPTLNQFIAYLLLILGLILFICFLSQVDDTMWNNLTLVSLLKVFLGTSIAIFVFAASYNLTINDWIFGNKIMIFFGDISYSIYLWHLIIFYLFLGLGRYGNTSLAHLGVTWTMGNTIIFLCPLVILISYLSYRYIELPFLHKKSKLI